jgi:single-stranded DNA-specific DHH superfamily exonuclease
MAYSERRAEALKRAEEQRKRIERQREEELKRAIAARARGEAKTGIDELEKVKIAKQDMWRRKWIGRMEKWNARLKKRER